jgi:hypothetical protein
MKILEHIKKKITDNKIILTKAEKGKAKVTMCQIDYSNKVEEFIEQSHIAEVSNHPTYKLNK